MRWSRIRCKYRFPNFRCSRLWKMPYSTGILHCDRKDMRLTIRSWRADGEAVIQIEDNGCGMEEAKAKRLQNAQIEPGSSYGVANVRKRLELFEKEKGEFLVESRIGAGTCITIKIQEPGNKEL